MVRSIRVVAAGAVALCVLGPLDAARAAGSPQGVGTVSAAHVTRITSTSVDITWRNPARSTGTEIRLARGDRAPTSPTAGRHAGAAARGRTAAIIARLAPGTAYTLALFAHDAKHHAGRRVVLHVHTGPAAPAPTAAYDQGSDSIVHWTLPRSTPFRSLVVRYAAGAVAPATPTAGTGVRLPSARATGVRLTGLTKGTRYAASVFTVDAARRPSTPAVTRFVTLSDPVRAGDLTGRVTDPSGRPLAGVEVRAGYRDDTDAPDAVTDADGRYTVEATADTILRFAGQQIVGGIDDTGGYAPADDYADVIPGRTTQVPTLQLVPGAVLTGHALHVDGTPAADVRVSATAAPAFVFTNGGVARSGSDFTVRPATTSGQDGSFTLRGVPVGEAVRLCTGDPGTGQICADRTRQPSHSSAIDVGAVPSAAGQGGGTVSGQVVFGTLGLAGVALSIDPTDDADGTASTTSGPDGTFAVDRVPAGTYRACSAPLDDGGTGFAARCSAPFTVVDAGTAHADVSVRRGAALTGVVLDPAGHAVAGADVQVDDPAHEFDDGWSSSIRTDAHGRFRAFGVAAGRYRACATPESTPGWATGLLGRCSRSAPVDAGRVRADTVVTLARGAAVVGRVLAGGHPLAGAIVNPGSLDDTTGPADDLPFTALGFTDRAGNYRVVGLTPGRYRLCPMQPPGTEYFAFGSGADPTCPHGTDVRTVTGRATRAADLSLPVTSAIAVSVHDVHGAPLSGAEAVAVHPCTERGCDGVSLPGFGARDDLDLAQGGIADADGRTQLAGLEVGHYSVCVYAYWATTAAGGSPTGYADRCTSSRFDVAVTAGRTSTVAITVADGGVVSGTVTDLDGHPLGGVRVGASGTDTSGRPSLGEGHPPAVTGSDGGYSIIGVAPGAQPVCVGAADAVGPSVGGYLDQCAGGRPGSSTGTPVTVTSGASTRVDLALTPGVRITGTLRERGNDEAPYGEVELFAGRATEALDSIDVEDGTWRTTVLPAGTYRVCALDAAVNPDYGQCWRGVTWDPDTDAPLSRATPLTLSAGGLQTGVDLTLVPRRH